MRVQLAGGCSRKGAHLRHLFENTAAHSLDSVTLNRVRHLVAHHGRHARLVLGLLQNAGKERDLAARQAKGINDFIVLNDGEFPFIVRAIGHCRNTLTDSSYHRIHFRIGAQRKLLEDVAIRAEPHLYFFVFGEKD